MANAYDIPTVTAGWVIGQLTDLYASAYAAGSLPQIPSVALWGPMGIGKSSAVKAIASRLSERIGYEVPVTDIRLLNFSPVDLRGIPTADANREFTVWLKPRIFEMRGDGPHILFLDEISAAPQSLQAAAYQIALDKQVGEHRLAQNCIVICAGNRTTDKSVAFRMPKALANRLIHFEIAADFDSWYEWAVENHLDSRVIGYLSFANDMLIREPGLEELAFPTPRSWEFVSRLLTITGKEPNELHGLLSGCIGVKCAVEFEGWCRVCRSLPSVKDILSGRAAARVKEVDALHALVSSLLACMDSRSQSLSAEELGNVCAYASAFPADFSALFFRGLLKLDGMNLRLAKVPAFLEWMKRNKDLI